MASSSNRKQTLGINTPEGKMFHTIIYPNKAQIEIPDTFKKNWYKKLKKHDHGWLLRKDGTKCLVHLHIHKYDSYLSSGIMVANAWNLSEPTAVLMEYANSDNRFEVTIIKNEAEIHNPVLNSEIPSTPKRLTRLQLQRKSWKSFKTVISPLKEEIPMPQPFKQVWLSELNKHDHGWLQYDHGKSLLVNMWIQNDDSYLTNGKFICKVLNILEPTQVLLDYQIDENRFNVKFLSPEDDATLITKENSPNYNINNSNDNSAAPDQAYNESSFNSTITNIHLLDLDFNQAYTWQKVVTKAQASLTKTQVLYIPRETVREAIGDVDSIILQAAETLELTKCKIVTSGRYGGEVEKHLTTGWYDFLRHNNIKEGDKLIFKVNRSATVMQVNVVRKNDK